MKKIQKLVLVESKEIEFKDKETGEQISKWKYSFLNNADEIVVGYLDDSDYDDEVQTVGTFADGTPKLYPWEGKIFQNKVTWKLVPR